MKKRAQQEERSLAQGVLDWETGGKTGEDLFSQMNKYYLRRPKKNQKTSAADKENISSYQAWDQCF